ncbi:NUDIX hydrolase [Actinomadura rupiterrae]|uniref:NUDIX hydrolase n=1 Tax=Actinomadura rupiterrae TaxID=559627 RepID=UPI0020A46A26|nr:NUDIX hydrolase [Actinomadura rupiterrae]MCP2334747.1 ADP-ribose pyrophosphatase YjhB (NUDIX family) [Actinomadura rupiterrae]
MPEFHRIKLRVGALVFHGDEVALIRRPRAGAVLHSLPGGNVEPAEDLPSALRRELAEELALDLDDATPPQLLWVVDQMVTRPGPTPSPRKLHLVYRLHITADVRRTLATEEDDDGHDSGEIVWLPYRDTVGLSLYPPVAARLASLPSPTSPVPDAAAPGITDANYSWL